MAYIKADNEQEQKHFDFLEKLRQSGVTNMFGAGPCLYEEFPEDFDVEEKRGLNQGYRSPGASACVSKWMNLHSDPTRVLEESDL
jgi:hypothetical protein